MEYFNRIEVQNTTIIETTPNGLLSQLKYLLEEESLFCFFLGLITISQSVLHIQIAICAVGCVRFRYYHLSEQATPMPN